ncbi:MAG: hypothetical protein ACRDK2_17440 [Solirubrobacteraceae bacterium]
MSMSDSTRLCGRYRSIAICMIMVVALFVLPVAAAAAAAAAGRGGPVRDLYYAPFHGSLYSPRGDRPLSYATHAA